MSTLALSNVINEYQYDDIAQRVEDISFDRYDAMFAGMSGLMAGLIDVFFVGVPDTGALTKIADNVVDDLVKKAAKLSGWNPKSGQENNIASAIGYFERNFKVNYDHRSSVDVNGAFKMATINHHIKSLGHSPDPIGLFFSILDQFTNTATYVSDGKLIRIDTTDSDFRLEGSNFIAKLFSGFVNWLGHVLSDIAGSSGSRGNGGRGSGLPIPFMNLFQFINVGQFQVGKHLNDFATVMVKVFQEGYDFRHGLAMAVPVLFNELMIRAFYVIRRHFQYKLPWRECLPSMKDKTLRWMLLISTGAMCLVDGADAVIRGGGNAVLIFLRMNLIAWIRLIYLVLKELYIFVKPILKALWKHVKAWIKDKVLTAFEKKQIAAFYDRINNYQVKLDEEFKLFYDELLEEHKTNMLYIQAVRDAQNSDDAINKSVLLAKHYQVDEKSIMHNTDDVRKKLFGGQ